MMLVDVTYKRYFLEAKGYAETGTTIYNDNLSAMLLEKNGRASTRKRTRHINIRYFFVADRVKSGEVNTEHCHCKEQSSRSSEN
jgi:hypothetical protein